MKNSLFSPLRLALLLVVGLNAIVAFGQGQKPLKEKLRTKLDNAWFGDSLIYHFRNNKEVCEQWVRCLKQKGLETDELRESYEVAKTSYDAVLDAMALDVEKANTVGEIYSFVATSSRRKEEYRILSAVAERKCAEFIEQASHACVGDTFAAGIIAQFIFNTFIDTLVPDFVQRLSEVFRDAVKAYYLDRINGLRFNEWEKVI